MRSTTLLPVKGSVHSSRILCFPCTGTLQTELIHLLNRCSSNSSHVVCFLTWPMISHNANTRYIHIIIHLGRVLHSDDNLSVWTRDKVHSSTHAFHHFTLKEYYDVSFSLRALSLSLSLSLFLHHSLPSSLSLI